MSGVLVTGASGILGDALLRAGHWPDAVGTVHLRSSTYPSVAVDLTDEAAVAEALAELRPRVVVHTVALTDVDACEREPGRAFAVTAATTHNLAVWLARHSPETLLVYISSDQVYPGTGLNSEDRTQPLNLYGQSKRAAELAAAQAPRCLVLRTNFFGHSEMRPSYTDWIAATARAGSDVHVDPAATFSALHLDDLVALLAAAVELELEGVFNLGARDWIRKLDFARDVAASAVEGGEARVVEREPDPDRAPRPLRLELDVSRIRAALGQELPSMADGLARVRAELEAAAHAA